MIDGLVIEVLGGDRGLDDLVQNLLTELLSSDIRAMLGRDDDGVDTEGNNSAVVMPILDGDLGLGVGAQPRKGAVATSSRHGSVELVGELESEGEQLGGLIGSIAEHDTLITGTEVLQAVVEMEALGNIGRLLLNGDEKVEGLVIEALGGVIIADILDGVADNLLVVNLGLGGDFPEDHDHAGLGGRLASDLGEGVIGQAGIENGIRDLVGNLVGVSFTDRLGLSGLSVSEKLLSGSRSPTYGEEEGPLIVVLPPAHTVGVDSIGTVGGHFFLGNELEAC